MAFGAQAGRVLALSGEGFSTPLAAGRPPLGRKWSVSWPRTRATGPGRSRPLHPPGPPGHGRRWLSEPVGLRKNMLRETSGRPKHPWIFTTESSLRASKLGSSWPAPPLPSLQSPESDRGFVRRRRQRTFHSHVAAQAGPRRSRHPTTRGWFSPTFVTSRPLTASSAARKNPGPRPAQPLPRTKTRTCSRTWPAT